MTAQVSGTCAFDGRKWAVERWDGDYSVVPTSKSLGIRTQSVSTANWSGRIDHFIVSRSKLYLLKIEVNFSQDYILELPDGAEREVLCRYETIRVCDTNGERTEIREHRFEYLVFHDLPVPYTGDLFLSYPWIDYWDQPNNADAEDDDRMQLILSFDAGVLISADDLRVF